MSQIQYMSVGDYYFSHQAEFNALIRQSAESWLSKASDASVYNAFFSCGMDANGQMPEEQVTLAAA